VPRHRRPVEDELAVKSYADALPAAHLRQITDKATADAKALERAALGDLRIDTDGRTIEQLADAIAAQTDLLR
jgi:hypothetical protein